MKIFIIAILLMSSAFAKTRVESVSSEDISDRLSKIEELQGYLSLAKKDLVGIEQTLAKASAQEKNEKTFVIIRDIAAATAALSFYNTVGAIKLPIDPWTLLMTGIGASTVTVGAEVGVLLSKNEAKSLREKTKELKDRINSRQTELQTEVKILCKEEPRHKLCY